MSVFNANTSNTDIQPDRQTFRHVCTQTCIDTHAMKQGPETRSDDEWMRLTVSFSVGVFTFLRLYFLGAYSVPLP